MIDFKTYKYIGEVDPSKPESYYSYNNDYYQELLSNNRYQDAADYASKFILTDAEKNRQLHNEIETLRTQGKIIEAVYKKIEDPAVLRQVEEADNIGVPGGYKRLRNKRDASGKLLYKTDKEFFEAYPMMARQLELLESIGNSKDRKATSFSLVFNPKRYGEFDIDVLAKDNNDNLDYFLQQLNMSSLDDLRKVLGYENVSYDEKTGNTTVHIDKNNDLAIPALMALKWQDRDTNKVSIFGYDDNGLIDRNYYNNFLNQFSLFDSSLHNLANISASIHENTNPNIYSQGAGASSLLKYKYKNTSIGDFNDAIAFSNDVYKLKKRKTDLFTKEEYNKLLVSTSTFDITDDYINSLDKALEVGRISETQYNKLKEQDLKNWVDRIRQLPYIPGMMSNVSNKLEDNRFSPLGQEDYQLFTKMLSGYKDNEVIMSGMVLDGEIGVLVTLPTLNTSTTSNKSRTNDDKKATLFIPASSIPGALGSLQQKINSDTRLKAEKDYSDMLNWRVKHRLLDGSTVSTDGENILKSYNDNSNYIISKDQAIRDLDRDIILRRSKYIKFNNISYNGDLNEDAYKLVLSNAMIGALYDLYPNLNFEDVSGRVLGRDISYNIIFDDNDSLLDYSNSFTSDVYNALFDVKQMYKYLLNDARNYTTINK